MFYQDLVIFYTCKFVGYTSNMNNSL